MSKSLAEWLSWLESRHPVAIDMGLDRVGKVADRSGLRQLGCPVIAVGGTNGKGSTVATLVSVYQAAGLKVGCYTSPHLVHFNERINVNGSPVSDAELVKAFEAIAQTQQIISAQQDVSLTYFEFTTLAAFHIFKQSALDVVILEVGLGGRLDAVNLVDADVAVITSIGIDHVEYLGDTREAIAIEKAGILRKEKPAVCGDENPPGTLIVAAKSAGSDLRLRDKDFSFTVHGETWDWQCAQQVWKNLPVPKLALENVSTALMAIQLSPVKVAEEAVRAGLQQASLPGRLQKIAGSPDVILDVAHNPHGAKFLMSHLSQVKPGQQTFAVFAMLADKDIAGVIDCCLGRIDRWFVAGLPVPRAAASQTVLPLLLERGCAVAGRFDSVAVALAEARQQARHSDRILVFGSFYTVAAVLRAE